MAKTKDYPKLNSLQVQISLNFLSAGLALILIMGAVLYYTLSGILLRTELDNTVAAVQRSGNYIEVYISKLKGLSEIVATAPDTTRWLQSGAGREGVAQLIRTVLDTDPALASIVLVSKSGEIISNEKNLDMTVSSDMMKEPWYVKAVHSQSMPVLTSVRQQEFSMDKNTWVISVSREITDGAGNNLGVLLIDIRYQVLESFLAGLNLGSTGYPFILNSEDAVVYHPDTGYFEDPAKTQKLVEISRMKDGYDARLGILTHHTQINGTNWTLVGLSSLDSLGVLRRQLMEILLLTGAILSCIVLGSGLMTARKIVAPIHTLQQAMAAVESGMPRVEIAENSFTEVRDLTVHYNHALTKVQELMARMTEKEQALREAEIKSLYGQINPHFLYNTLDTIVWMAEFHDSEKVIETTKALGRFFRLSLSAGNDLIPLRDEAEQVAQYLFIQKQRYGERLTYAIAIDPSHAHYTVPKLILQPIVENAVYHGIRELDAVGCIEIRSAREGEDLILTVADNGVGFDSSKRKETDIKLGGVGIDNVHRRLQLYYGERYGVEVSSVVGEGTVVRLRLPIGASDSRGNSTEAGVSV